MKGETFTEREWLQSIRSNLRLTQKKIARLIGISQNYYSWIEIGKRRPSPEVAKKISDVLKFVDYGFDWTEFFNESN